MTKLIHKILHIFNLIIVGLIIIITLVLSMLHLATPYLQANKPQIEIWASEYLHTSIVIDKISVGQDGLEPVIRFADLAVLNKDKSAVVFKITDLRIGIDLIGSLINWRIQPGLLIVNGANIYFCQDKNGNVTVSGLEDVFAACGKANQLTKNENITLPTLEGRTTQSVLTTHAATNAYDLFTWLFTQGKIILRNINLSVSDSGTVIFKIDALNARMTNDVVNRRLRASGKLFLKNADVPANFLLSLALKGNILDQKPFAVFGNLDLTNIALNLTKDNSAKTPAISNLKFLIPASGEIKLHLLDSSFNANKLFRQALQINNLTSEINWQQIPEGLQIEVKNATADNGDGNVYGSGKFIIPSDDQSPLVDMLFHFEGFDVSRAPIYYPTGIMVPSLVNWLDHAFIAGKKIAGTVLLQGRLNDFPYDHNDGHFLVDSQFEDITLHYFPDWPDIANLNGKLIFENRSMRIEANSGMIIGVPMQQTKVTIDDLANAVLNVDGNIFADSMDGLRFIKSCPLKETIGKYFQEMQLFGRMQLGLKLAIPLAQDSKAKTQVLGNLALQNNTMQLPAWNLNVTNLHGKINFNEESINTNDLHGELFNRPIDLTIATENKKNNLTVTKINFAGLMPISLLQEKFDSSIANYAKGSFNYQAELKLSKLDNQIDNKLQIISDLKGISLNIPPLIKKSFTTPVSFKAILDFTYGKPLQLLINYNKDLSALFIFNRSNRKINFYSGEVHFGGGEVHEQKSPGLVISGVLPKVDWSQWQDYFFAKQKKILPDETEPEVKTSLINRVDLLINEFDIFGQTLKNIKINFASLENKYLLSLINENISGTITIPHDLENGIVLGKFDRLYLAEDNKSEKAASSLKPRNLPNINLTIDDFHDGKKSFGNVIFDATSHGNEVNIDKLQMISPLFNLNAAGTWALQNGIEQSIVSGNFSSPNLGELLKQWGMTSSLIGGNAAANFNLHWLGAIFNPSLKVSNGAVLLNVRKGRVIDIGEHAESEVGLGNVINLLSLQSLPRRLMLDFSDWVAKGFSFDTMRGNFNLRGGNAFTSNTNIDGTIAQIKINGRIGLVNKDYDLRMIVFPHVTSSLPVVAAIAGGPAGPAIGAATWVAEKLVISNVMKGVAHYIYQITGSWQNPNVEKLNK